MPIQLALAIDHRQPARLSLLTLSLKLVSGLTATTVEIMTAPTVSITGTSLGHATC